MKFDRFEGFFVTFDKLFDTTNNGGVKEISIEGKTVSNTFVKRRKFGSETINRYLVIVVKVLEDSNNLFDCFDIRVGLVAVVFGA